MTMDLRLEAHTLKEKRQLVKSVLSRMRQRHNLSVHEADFQGVCTRARLAACWVGPDPDSAQKVLESVIQLAELAGGEVIDQHIEYF